MRIVTIKCDRCGNVIPDKLVKISMEKIRRKGPNLGKEFLRELNELEFCEQCAKDIKRFIIQPLYMSNAENGEVDGQDNEEPDMAEKVVNGLIRYDKEVE